MGRSGHRAGDVFDGVNRYLFLRARFLNVVNEPSILAATPKRLGAKRAAPNRSLTVGGRRSFQSRKVGLYLPNRPVLPVLRKSFSSIQITSPVSILVNSRTNWYQTS